MSATHESTISAEIKTRALDVLRIADRSLGWSAEDFRRCARAALNGAAS